MKTLLTTLFIMSCFVVSVGPPNPNPNRSKFYDFNEQLINGKIRRPTAIYINARERARFNRLLRLKKSFLPKLFETSKDKVFK
jgi:hypothetical protein